MNDRQGIASGQLIPFYIFHIFNNFTHQTDQKGKNCISKEIPADHFHISVDRNKLIRLLPEHKEFE